MHTHTHTQDVRCFYRPREGHLSALETMTSSTAPCSATIASSSLLLPSTPTAAERRPASSGWTSQGSLTKHFRIALVGCLGLGGGAGGRGEVVGR